MDDKSEFQGKYIVYSAHPNVVFKVEDRGGAFVGKGDSAIDIAYDNRDMEHDYKTQRHHQGYLRGGGRRDRWHEQAAARAEHETS